MLLTYQVISVTFCSEREKSEKFCSEALISAWGSFACCKSTTRDPWPYFPSKGSHTQDFYTLKKSIDLGRVLNLQTSDLVASMIATRPPGSKNKELNKSAVAAYFWYHKHKFEEEPKLLKYINNRPLSELLIWERIFIYGINEVAINFDITQFNDLFKLMDADNGHEMERSSTQSASSWWWSKANS